MILPLDTVAAAVSSSQSLAHGIMIGGGFIGPTIGIGLVGANYLAAVGRNPEAAKFLGQALVGDMRRGAHDIDLDAVHLGEDRAQLLGTFGRIVRGIPGQLAFLLGGLFECFHVGANRHRAKYKRSSDGD